MSQLFLSETVAFTDGASVLTWERGFWRDFCNGAKFPLFDLESLWVKRHISDRFLWNFLCKMTTAKSFCFFQNKINIGQCARCHPLRNYLARSIPGIDLSRFFSTFCMDQLRKIRRHHWKKSLKNVATLRSGIFIKFQQIALKLGNFTHLKALFWVLSTDFPELVHVKSWKKNMKRSIGWKRTYAVSMGVFSCGRAHTTRRF